MEPLAETFRPTDEDYLPEGPVPSCPYDISRLSEDISRLTRVPPAGMLALTLQAGPAKMEADSLCTLLYELQVLLESARNGLARLPRCSAESGSIPSGSEPPTVHRKTDRSGPGPAV